MRVWFLSLLLIGCATKNPWNESEIAASTRLTLRESGPLKLEMVGSQEGVEAFLTLDYGTFKLFEDNLCRVRFELGEKCFDTTAHHYKGGQRLKLSPELFTHFLSHLDDEEELTIRLYGYKLSLQVRTIVTTYNHIRGKYEQADQIARDDNDRSRHG